MEENTKQLLRDADSFRKLAFFGIAVSTVATLTAIVAVPMLYNYMVSRSLSSLPPKKGVFLTFGRSGSRKEGGSSSGSCRLLLIVITR